MGKKKPRPTTGGISYMSQHDAVMKRERKSVVLDQALDEIYERDGNVTAEALVEYARDPQKPVHAYFVWNNDVAGERYRLVQATSMIMASKMIVILAKERERAIEATPHEPVRRLVSAFRGEGYQLRPDALSDTNSRSAIIEKQLAKLRSWIHATVDIEELADIREVLEQAVNAWPVTQKAS